jgi:dTDP-4-dehydrorhamnose reductase
MDRPRILLIGKVGQVGWELRRTIAPMAQLVCVDFPEIDLGSGDSIRKWVSEARPRIVINAAAYTAVDKAEAEPDKAMKINGLAPGILAEEARKAGALMVHYSTDYVFDGTKTEPYVETDAPNPLGVYGRSKLAGDEAVRAAGGAHLIFRLCWVYGARGQNFMLTMMRLAREREKLQVVSDQVGCPTWSRLIAETTTLAVTRTIAAGDFAAFRVPRAGMALPALLLAWCLLRGGSARRLRPSPLRDIPRLPSARPTRCWGATSWSAALACGCRPGKKA